MLHVEGLSADAIWRQLAARLRAEGAVQESRDQPTRELLHATFTIADPRQRLVFARAMNPAFAIAEVLWIMAGANDARFLSFWNPRMMRFTDDREKDVLHGAYGYRLGSRPRLSVEAKYLRHGDGKDRLDQLKAAYQALRHTPHSRQVVLQIWDGQRDLPDPAPRSHDVPCNLMSHLMIRRGRLEWLQIMRSNDLVWGLPYNIVQFTSMQEIVAGWLDIDVGTYNQVSDSLHVYERHWDALESLASVDCPPPRNDADLRVPSYADWERLWARFVDAAIGLTRYRGAADLVAVARSFEGVPLAYAQWMALLTAEALRRRRHRTFIPEYVERAGPFWGASWLRWQEERQRQEKVGAVAL